VSSSKFLGERRDVLKKWIEAQVELTEWIKAHPEESKKIFIEEIKAETSKSVPQEIIDRAWSRLELTNDPIKMSLLKSAEDAHQVGFLKEKPDLSRIYMLDLLNEVLRSKNMAEVP
jgi:NitT/TauT family transport system substrate-binding protein